MPETYINNYRYLLKREQIDNEILNDKNTYSIKQNNFLRIPGKAIVYWISDNFINTFDKGISIDTISDFTGSQNITANNSKYLRYFWEIDYNKIGEKLEITDFDYTQIVKVKCTSCGKEYILFDSNGGKLSTGSIPKSGNLQIINNIHHLSLVYHYTPLFLYPYHN